jgi:hypothetical protein
LPIGFVDGLTNAKLTAEAETTEQAAVEALKAASH